MAIDTPEPSPFSHEILNANPYAYLDDAPLEERRARAVQMRRTIRAGRGWRRRARSGGDRRGGGRVVPDVRDADELHDALLTLIVVPPVREWEEYFRTLREAGRATVLSAGGANFWVAAERLKSARLLYPGFDDRSRDRRLRSLADLRPGDGGHRDAARMARVERTADSKAA